MNTDGHRSAWFDEIATRLDARTCARCLAAAAMVLNVARSEEKNPASPEGALEIRTGEQAVGGTVGASATKNDDRLAKERAEQERLIKQRAAAEFKPLLTGKDMNGFDLVGGSPETWRVEDGVIKCAGKPNGYFATKRSYKNFELLVEFRYTRPPNFTDDASFNGNSGYLIYITGDHKVWPKCVEVQGQNREVGRIFAIGGGPAIKATDQPEIRAQVLRPVGEWNTLVISAENGRIGATLNGAIVCSTEPGELREGPIGFQSEGAEIHFRNLRINELP